MSQGCKASSLGLPTHLQQHSRGLGGCAHAAPQGAGEAAGASWAQLAWLGLRGGNGVEERLCRTVGEHLLHPSPAKGTQDPSAATGQGQGGGQGSHASPRSPPGAGVGTRFSCSVPMKPLQKSGGSERSRATTWAGRDGVWGCWQHSGYTPHLRDTLTLDCRGVSSMMASGVGLAELCPTSVGPNTRDRLSTSILQSGLRDTLRGGTDSVNTLLRELPGQGALHPQPRFPTVGHGAWMRGREPGDGDRPRRAPARMSPSPEQMQHEEGQGVPVGWGQLAHHVAQGCAAGGIIRDVCSGTVEQC